MNTTYKMHFCFIAICEADVDWMTYNWFIERLRNFLYGSCKSKCCICQQSRSTFVNCLKDSNETIKVVKSYDLIDLEITRIFKK